MIAFYPVKLASIITTIRLRFPARKYFFLNRLFHTHLIVITLESIVAFHAFDGFYIFSGYFFSILLFSVLKGLKQILQRIFILGHHFPTCKYPLTYS